MNFENKKVLLNNVSFILNSIPPSPSGDIVINNFSKTIVENKKSIKVVWLFFIHKCIWKSSMVSGLMKIQN